MPLNSTQKRFSLFVLGIIALLALVYFLAFVVPGIGKYVYIAVLAVVGLFILYVSILPLINYLSEHAGSILEVYLDETGGGIHIFSTFSVSRYKVMKPSIRHIQYYFIATATGKLYYKELFSHEQQAIAGEAGYTGYSSFETSVMKSEELKQAMESFSQKTQWQLQLGKHIHGSDKDYYQFSAGDQRIEIKKIRGTFDDVFNVCCYSGNPGKLNWKRKL